MELLIQIIKIKEFLFKLIHKICPCRNLLFKWKLSESKCCIYCNSNSQDYKHLLWDCPEANSIWTLLNDNTLLNVSFDLIVLGIGNYVHTI